MKATETITKGKINILELKFTNVYTSKSHYQQNKMINKKTGEVLFKSTEVKEF